MMVVSEVSLGVEAREWMEREKEGNMKRVKYINSSLQTALYTRTLKHCIYLLPTNPLLNQLRDLLRKCQLLLDGLRPLHRNHDLLVREFILYSEFYAFGLDVGDDYSRCAVDFAHCCTEKTDCSSAED